MPAGSFTRPAGRSAAVRSRDQLDRLTTWPATDRPRVQTGYQGDGREQDLDRLTTRPFADVHPGRGPRHAPLVDAGGELHTAGWSIGRGSEQRPARQAHHVAGYRSAAWQTGYQGDGREQDLDRLTTRPFADVHPGRGPRHVHPVDAGGELHTAGWSIGRGSEQRPARQAHHVAGYRSAALQTGYQGDGREQDLDRLPRGRLPTCILVEALDTFTRSMPAGSFTQPGCRSARTRTRATRPRGRTSTRSHVAVCRRASWSRPWTRSPGRCRRGASRGRVADRCGPGPGRHGRGQDLDTLPRGRLPTCILVEALDTLP